MNKDNKDLCKKLKEEKARQEYEKECKRRKEEMERIFKTIRWV